MLGDITNEQLTGLATDFIDYEESDLENDKVCNGIEFSFTICNIVFKNTLSWTML